MCVVGTSTPDEAGSTTQDMRTRVETMGSHVVCLFEAGQKMFGERRRRQFSATRGEEEEARSESAGACSIWTPVCHSPFRLFRQITLYKWNRRKKIVQCSKDDAIR